MPGSDIVVTFLSSSYQNSLYLEQFNIISCTKYVTELLSPRDIKRQNLRLDNDFYILKVPEVPNFSRSKGAFSYCGPKLWNELPYSIRCLTNIDDFKKALKTHFFSIAFS